MSLASVLFDEKVEEVLSCCLLSPLVLPSSKSPVSPMVPPASLAPFSISAPPPFNSTLLLGSSSGLPVSSSILAHASPVSASGRQVHHSTLVHQPVGSTLAPPSSLWLHLGQSLLCLRHGLPGFRSLSPPWHMDPLSPPRASKPITPPWNINQSAPPWLLPLSALPGSLVPLAPPWSVVALPTPRTSGLSVTLCPITPSVPLAPPQSSGILAPPWLLVIAALPWLPDPTVSPDLCLLGSDRVSNSPCSTAGLWLLPLSVLPWAFILVVPWVVIWILPLSYTSCYVRRGFAMDSDLQGVWDQLFFDANVSEYICGHKVRRSRAFSGCLRSRWMLLAP
ncbi:hypothetical protein PO909_023396 [Leuciscus waleckii]